MQDGSKVGCSWKKGTKIRRQDQEGWTWDCKKPFSFMLQKKRSFKYMEKSPCPDLMVPIWWDFVKKIGTIKAIQWYLDTIHNLVVRVWRIGSIVICGSCACFRKHNSRPQLTSHWYLYFVKFIPFIVQKVVWYLTNGFGIETMYDYYISMKSMFLVWKLFFHLSIVYVRLIILLPWTKHKQPQNHSKSKVFQTKTSILINFVFIQ